MKILVYPTPAEVVRSLAEMFTDISSKAIAERKQCNVLLSGGGSPKQLYELLASEYKSSLSWSSFYFFFGDERYVPFKDPQNNGLMVKKALFDPLSIAENHIFYVDTSLTVDEAAKDYERDIRSHFKNTRIKFDIVLLGLGDNSHTASLFPYTPVLHEKNAFVKEVYIEELHQHRITLTAPILNDAHNIFFLVYGEGKAGAVHNIIEGKKDSEQYPAQLISPSDGELYWMLDTAAASLIKS